MACPATRQVGASVRWLRLILTSPVLRAAPWAFPWALAHDTAEDEEDARWMDTEAAMALQRIAERSQ